MMYLNYKLLTHASRYSILLSSVVSFSLRTAILDRSTRHI